MVISIKLYNLCLFLILKQTKMIKATFRFFYGSDDQRTLYNYTIELNSLFFTAAFIESNNIVTFLQVAGCDILDVKLTEWPN